MNNIFQDYFCSLILKKRLILYHGIFLFKMLEHLNFGESVRQLVRVFHKNISSAVIQSGHLSSFFSIQRGCRQGDPLSPYLFVICVECLATKVRKKKVNGITVYNTEFKISQYADDTSAIIDGTETSLKLWKSLQNFQE